MNVLDKAEIGQFLLNEYHNMPQSKYVNIILIRKTESETIFRTEGSGERLSREYVAAGQADRQKIYRSVITKRKQTAVERRTGRADSRQAGVPSAAGCALNTNKPCGKCIDCWLYGYAVGKSEKGEDKVGTQKSRVITEDAFSILSANQIFGTRTFGGAFEDGTMRDPENKAKASTSIQIDEEYIKPESHFLDIETLKDVTRDEVRYVVGNILRSTRYGAISSKTGRIKNTIAGIVFSDVEIFSTLELTQAVHDSLMSKAKEGAAATNAEVELPFPLDDAAVFETVNKATVELLKKVIGREPVALTLEEINALEQEVQTLYRQPEEFLKRLAAAYPKP
jgi:CRISPR-associated protein Csc2